MRVGYFVVVDDLRQLLAKDLLRTSHCHQKGHVGLPLKADETSQVKLLVKFLLSKLNPLLNFPPHTASRNPPHTASRKHVTKKARVSKLLPAFEVLFGPAINLVILMLVLAITLLPDSTICGEARFRGCLCLIKLLIQQSIRSFFTMHVGVPKAYEAATNQAEALICTTAVRDDGHHCVKLLASLRQVSIKDDIDACKCKMFSSHIVLLMPDAQVLSRNRALNHRSPEVPRVKELVQFEDVQQTEVSPLVDKGLLRICLVDKRLVSLQRIKPCLSVELKDFDRSSVVPQHTYIVIAQSTILGPLQYARRR